MKRWPEKLAERFKFKVVAITLRGDVSVWKNTWTAIACAEGKIYKTRTYEVDIVDRVGGGDSFTAGFVWAYRKEKDIQKGVDYGVAPFGPEALHPRRLQLVHPGGGGGPGQGGRPTDRPLDFLEMPFHPFLSFSRIAFPQLSGGSHGEQSREYEDPIGLRYDSRRPRRVRGTGDGDRRSHQGRRRAGDRDHHGGAIDVMREVSRRYGKEVVLGAGTVLDGETARMAILAGAEFIVAPNLDRGTLEVCSRYSKISVPGAPAPPRRSRPGNGGLIW